MTTKTKVRRRPRYTQVSVREALDGSEAAMLRDELQEWRDNLDGANMGHLPKYDEVSEAVDTLDNVADDFQNNLDQLVEALEKTKEGEAILTKKLTVRTLKARASRSDRLSDMGEHVRAALDAIQESFKEPDLEDSENADLWSLMHDVEDQLDELDNVMFPGMY